MTQKATILTIIASILGPVVVGFAIIVAAIYRVDSADAEREREWQLKIAKELGKLEAIAPRLAGLEDAQREIAKGLGKLEAIAPRLAGLEGAQRDTAKELSKIATLSARLDTVLEATDQRLVAVETIQIDLTETVGALTGQVEGLSDRITDFDKEVSTIISSMQGWSDRVAELPLPLLVLHQKDVERLKGTGTLDLHLVKAQ